MATFYEAETLAEFVRSLMDEQGYSYDTLSERSGVGRSTLYRVVNEGVIPKDSILRQLATYANVPFPWLHDLSHPELRRPKKFSGTTMLVADLIEQLPEDLRQIVLAQIRATVDSRRKQSGKGGKKTDNLVTG